MTREEAWNRIDAIIARHEIDDEYVTITSFLDYDALRMARKALDQEPILDKIRDEITEIRDSWEKDNYHDEADALTLALRIIDEHKAEVKPQESEDKG